MTPSEFEKLGYAIVFKSTDDIRPQLKRLEKNGCGMIYQDFAPNPKSERPGLADLIMNLKPCSEIICCSFLSLFKDIETFNPIIDYVNSKNSRMKFLDENIVIDQGNYEFHMELWADMLEFKRMVRYRWNNKGSIKHLT